jgi:hypothetical protein
MNDAAFTGSHGIEPKRLARFADAISGDTSRQRELGDSRRSIIARIKANSIEKWRIEAQRAHGKIFERKKKFGVPLKQQALISTGENHKNFRTFETLRRPRGFVGSRFDANLASQIQASRRKDRGKPVAKGFSDTVAIQFRIFHERRIHKLFALRGPHRIAGIGRYLFFFAPRDACGSGVLRFKKYCCTTPTTLVVKM